ncbi:MAG: endonuclease/exonuclease/phosphatase family protein [Rhodoferax sp.]
MKLVSWNTQWCCGLDGVVSPARIVDQARALADFDVLCLQEIASGFEGLPGAPADQPQQLALLLPGYRVFFGAAVDEFDAAGRRRRFGNLIATRLPVLSVQHHPLPWPADPCVPSMPRMCTVVTVLSPQLGAVRVMTTHLAYYSVRQRQAQVQALRALHRQACTLAWAPPQPEPGPSPFEARTHTLHAVLCGDFNFDPDSAEYAALQAVFGSDGDAEPGHASRQEGWRDAWTVCHPGVAHAPTFRVFDRQYGPDPVACDFFWISHSLTGCVRQVAVDGQAQASDHQPVLLALGA